MPGQAVHIGSWTDWSAPSAASRHILTLESRSGAILNNILLLLITFAGSRFWFIISFFIHRAGSHETRRGGLRRMTEVILRNQPQLGAITGLFKISSAWAGPSRSRTIALAAMGFAIFNLFAWTAAGLAETLIIIGPIVQASSSECGMWIPPLNDSPTAQYWAVQLAQAAQLHVSTCGSKNARPNCGRLFSPNVDLKLTHNSSCPFGDNLCFEGATAALDIDTGYISSADLGFNLPNPFTVRHTMQCSPLNGVQDVNVGEYNVSWPSGSTGTYESLYLYYGGLGGRNPLADPNGKLATYQYNKAFALYQKDYVLRSESWSTYDTAESGTLRWTPIPALLSPPSDTSIYFLSAGTLWYKTGTPDPWFLTSPAGPISLSAKWVSPLACHEQRQFCNPSNGKCSTPSTSRTLPDSADLGWDYLQADALKVLDWVTFPFFPMSYFIDNRGSSVLLASQKTFNGGSLSLDAEQWKLEVTNWMNLAIAGVKFAILTFGTGEQSVPGFQRILGDTEVCKRRMVKFRADGGDYTSYNLAGVLIIILVSLLIILVSFLLEPIFSRLARGSSGSRRIKNEAWRRDDMLELYRQTMEQQGIGPWWNDNWDIPITRSTSLMAETLDPAPRPPGESSEGKVERGGAEETRRGQFRVERRERRRRTRTDQ